MAQYFVTLKKKVTHKNSLSMINLQKKEVVFTQDLHLFKRNRRNNKRYSITLRLNCCISEYIF